MKWPAVRAVKIMGMAMSQPLKAWDPLKE
jgi:hypothetical protein